MPEWVFLLLSPLLLLRQSVTVNTWARFKTLGQIKTFICSISNGADGKMISIHV